VRNVRGGDGAGGGVTSETTVDTGGGVGLVGDELHPAATSQRSIAAVIFVEYFIRFDFLP
jgi:hypothetical protein